MIAESILYELAQHYKHSDGLTAHAYTQSGYIYLRMRYRTSRRILRRTAIFLAVCGMHWADSVDSNWHARVKALSKVSGLPCISFSWMEEEATPLIRLIMGHFAFQEGNALSANIRNLPANSEIPSSFVALYAVTTQSSASPAGENCF